MRQLAVLTLLLFAGCAQPYRTTTPPVLIGIVTGTARAVMERDWSDSVGQVERAYCVERMTILRSIDDTSAIRNGRDTLALDSAGEHPYLAVIVEQVSRAKVAKATPTQLVDIRCSSGQPIVHTHAPHTCQPDGTCDFGGVNAWQCFPSRVDYETLMREEMPFGVIQCDRRAFMFYWRRYFAGT